MASNIRVAVRVRPLNKKEREAGARNIISSTGNTVSLTNVNVEGQAEYGDHRERVKHFTFDYCYDGASEHSDTDMVACQELIYQDMGTEVLQAALEGYNACMFAYGQTGTGKTYTMMGYPKSTICFVSLLFQALFSHIEESPVEDNVTFRIEISFLEIYNERVRDLLQTRRRKERYTLKVREHPKHGPYVKDLSKYVVKDFSEIQALIDRGNENRTTASTHMHKHSSRSHAIVTVNLSQAKFEDNLPSEIISKVNLVDLAGSERADPSYHSEYKGRIKEGAYINKSLVTLGNVISVLAQRSLLNFSTESITSSQSARSSVDFLEFPHRVNSPTRRTRGLYIPYRDSVLTWLLKDSLGGNSKTLMIATISPASQYYGDTLSTLRYAQRAKSIVNKPKINEDDNVRLIRELRAQIEMLKRELEKARKLSPHYIRTISTSFSQEESESNRRKEAILEEIEIKKEQVVAEWLKKLGMQVPGSPGSSLYATTSNLVFCLENGLKVQHELKEGRTFFGRDDQQSDHFKELMGSDVLPNHCHIDSEDGEIRLSPEVGALCYVNSQIITEPVLLKHGDKIQMGKLNTFTFQQTQEIIEKLTNSGLESRLSVQCSSEDVSRSSSMNDLTMVSSSSFKTYDQK
ncbi:unnamed protein product [Lymnaea stagnalis]|uniref:Kinesin-like protein n=1 Tax=Lymnaea stagnalis TaxID=6523 RepID=A0AAV2HQS7_LYMST